MIRAVDNMHFLLISENWFTHEIKRHGKITSIMDFMSSLFERQTNIKTFDSILVSLKCTSRGLCPSCLVSELRN